jgi:hypothetical protein
MKMLLWGKMPIWWQTEMSMHRQIQRAPTGSAIAALKLYITFCMKANFQKQDGLPAGCVKMSVAVLARAVGLSKPMVISGLRQLQNWGLVTRTRSRPAVYQLCCYMTCANWTKIPSAHLYGGREGIALLKRMNNRGRRRLLSLQMYLYLAAIRNSKTLKAKVSYDRLGELLHAGRNEISAAISMLVEDDLITCRVAEPALLKNNTRPTNEYWLRGTKPLHIDTEIA